MNINTTILRLHAEESSYISPLVIAGSLSEAADEIDRLRAESQRYREALESIEGLTMSMVVHSNAFVSTMKSIARTALKGVE